MAYRLSLTKSDRFGPPWVLARGANIESGRPNNGTANT